MPKPTNAIVLVEWETNNARIISWILGLVEPSILFNAKGMWDYLRRVYNHENIARQFQLEYEHRQVSSTQ